MREMYLVQEKSIIYRSSTGHIICNDFYPALSLDAFNTAFVQTSFYAKAVSIISETVKSNQRETEANTLILNTKYFKQPGLIKAILDKTSKVLQVKSDIDLIVNTRQLKPGKYTFLDILENETNIYELVVNNNQYDISSKQRTENTAIKQAIAEKLKANISGEELFNTLFSFRNVISTNEHLKVNKIGNEDFADLNFSASNVEIKKFTKADLATFFESLVSVVQKTINTFTSTETTTIVKSPLTSYLPVEEILNQSSRAIIINELELLNNPTIPATIESAQSNVSYELKYFPESKKLQLPFSIWLLSESDDLTFEILKNSGGKTTPLKITLSELKNSLSNSFFSVGNKTLVKYHVELQSDCCNNLHLRVHAVDNEEFYSLIND